MDGGGGISELGEGDSSPCSKSEEIKDNLFNKHNPKLIMRKIETIDAQNTLARIKENIYLNVENPSKRVKAQYRIVQKAIIDLHGSLDDLNDLKDDI